MKVALTDRGVQQLLPPAQGRLEVRDTKIPGLALRITPNGVKTWTVLWHAGRQTRRHAIGPYPAVTLASARDWARQVLADAARGVDPGAERTAARLAPTVAAFAEEYMALPVDEVAARPAYGAAGLLQTPARQEWSRHGGP